MNNLRDLYDTIKDFGERHEMVNEVIFVKSEDELEHLEFNYRSLVFYTSEANISREANAPAYYIDFSVILIDKIPAENDEAAINSNDENLFILGQLQDFLQQEDYDADFSSVALGSETLDAYNVTYAACDIEFTLARKPFNRGINF